MPEKTLDKQIVILILFVSFLSALAKVLSDEETFKLKRFLIQIFVGGISGMIFGLLACWIVGENSYAVGAISGMGGVLGINGLTGMAKLFEKYIKNKFK